MHGGDMTSIEKICSYIWKGITLSFAFLVEILPMTIIPGLLIFASISLLFGWLRLKFKSLLFKLGVKQNPEKEWIKVQSECEFLVKDIIGSERILNSYVSKHVTKIKETDNFIVYKYHTNLIIAMIICSLVSEYFECKELYSDINSGLLCGNHSDKFHQLAQKALWEARKRRKITEFQYKKYLNMIENNNNTYTEIVNDICRENNNNKAPFAIITFLCFAIAGVSAFSVYQYAEYKNLTADYTKLQEEYDSLSAKYDDVIDEYSETQRNMVEARMELEKYQKYAVFVNEGSNYYHTYKCPLQKGSFWIYNVEAAEGRGYQPCPICRN